MTHWNHRIVYDNDVYTVREVYYDDENNPTGWSTAEVSLWGEDLEDLRWEMAAIHAALNKPILRIEGKRLVELEVA